MGLDLQRFERVFWDLRRGAAKGLPASEAARAAGPETPDSVELAMERLRAATAGKPGILERLDAIERRLAELEARPPCRCAEGAGEKAAESPSPRSVGILGEGVPRDLAQNAEDYLGDAFGH
ncbi:hypothetical protein [Streptomyces sp. 769]|uniref:hypothetical protein n=1 Tax=Streptomyces sp. 769 TaxID=1262452 RepID=UPI000589C521|nr:hypothetical protein [Streptomyces sp. 769]